jgi:hypothetical protein
MDFQMPLLNHLTMLLPKEEGPIENAFGILKKMFCELHGRIKLHITMIFNYYLLLHIT